MLEKIYNYANYSLSEEEKLSPSTPRRLSKEEQEFALRLLPKYFKDSEEELISLVETIQIVPKKIAGSTFFTSKTYDFIKEQFREMPELMRQIKAEYFSNLLGMDWEVATVYVENMDKLRKIIANKTGSSKVKLSDFNFRTDYTQEDLEKARYEWRRAEERWDNALDRCMPYGRTPSKECLELEEESTRAEKEYRMIERSLEFGAIVEQTPIKSATATYTYRDEKTIR